MGWFLSLGQRRRSALLAAGAVWVLALPLRAATAADSAAAQALFEQGKSLMQEGRAAEACPKFEESQRLDPGGGTLINLARCYEVVGRVASAWNVYLEAAAAAQASGNRAREKEARSRADALRPKLTRLVIDVSDEVKSISGLEIKRDGVPVGIAQWGVPIPTDPGAHTIEASAPGRQPWTSSVELRDPGQNVSITVPPLVLATSEVAPAPVAATAAATDVTAPAPKKSLGTQRTLALVAAGVGVVGVGVGTVFGLQSKSKHDVAEEHCTGTVCESQEGVDAGNDAYSAGTISTVAMVVGVAGLAGGAVLWFTAKPEPSGPQVGLGLGGVRVRGTW
jgi:hypothetical protein